MYDLYKILNEYAGWELLKIKMKEGDWKCLQPVVDGGWLYIIIIKYNNFVYSKY